MQRRQTRFPGITIMSDGRKRIRLRAVDPKTGRMKEVDRIINGSMDDALKLREELRTGLRSPDGVKAAMPRLGDYATSWLLMKKPSVKPSTARSYAEQLDRKVLPALGDFFVDKLTEQDVRAWLAKVAVGRSPATANGGLRVLRMVMGEAVEEFNLPKNPTARVRCLRQYGYTDEDPNVLTATELGRLLDAYREVAPKIYALALTLALTGLRYGEATALKWSDVDEEAGLIRIRRAQWRAIVSTTKTGTIRSVPLPPRLAEALREHRARMLAEQNPGLAQGWVFLNRDGRLLRRNSLREKHERALGKAGINRRFTVHGFRRTFNNLSRQVAGEIVTRSITGHVTQAMTEHYSHVDAAEKQQAAAKVVQLVFPTASTPGGGSGGGSETAPASPTCSSVATT